MKNDFENSQYFAPQPMNVNEEVSIPIAQQDQTLAQWLLDLEEIYSDLRHALKGETFDGEKWVQTTEPTINDIGIHDLLDTRVKSLINKNSFISDLPDEKIYQIAQSFFKDSIKKMILNRKKYGIRSNEDIHWIAETLADFVFIGLKRSERGMTIQALLKQIQVREYTAPEHQQKKQGIFDNLNLFRKR